MPLFAPHHVYVHFPYCLYKCHYCDFNSHAYERDRIPEKRYAQALLNELKWREREEALSSPTFFPKGTRINSVFFGGGTPSLMQPSDVEKFILELKNHFEFSSQTEITLEANPGTLTRELLVEFVQAGINRISLGVQSLRDVHLKRYGRIHTADAAREILSCLGSGTVSRASCDLMYGFPGQTLADWEQDLHEIKTYGLSHLSCYALTVEEGTTLARDVRDGKVQPPDHDLQTEMQIMTYGLLEDFGLPAYEISNFAKVGEECRHNLGYWNYQSYLGLGAGAVSQFVERSDDGKLRRVERQTNHKAPEHFMLSLSQNQSPHVIESIDTKTALKEYLMMGLRLTRGIDPVVFKDLFKEDFENRFSEILKNEISKGRLKKSGERIAPTVAGLLHMDAILKAWFDLI